MSDTRAGHSRDQRSAAEWLLIGLILLGVLPPWSAATAECPYHADLLLGVWESTPEGSALYRACGTITLESGYLVGPAAEVRLEAGERVSFLPGVRLQTGAKLQVRSGMAFDSQERVVTIERVGPGLFSARVAGGEPIHCDEDCATLTLEVMLGNVVELEAVADSGAVLWSWGTLPCLSSELECSFEVVEHTVSKVTFESAVTTTATFAVPAAVESSFVDPNSGVRITIPAGATTQPTAVRLIVATNALGEQTFSVEILDPESWAGDLIWIEIELPEALVTPESGGAEVQLLAASNLGAMSAPGMILPPSGQKAAFVVYAAEGDRVESRIPPGNKCYKATVQLLPLARTTVVECRTGTAALATPRCGTGNETVECPSNRQPVILVHGYRVRDGFEDIYAIARNEKDDYWNDFPYALHSAGYAPYVFRWNTAQRFEDAAFALREVVATVNNRHPGKPPLIVAHSFGGIVARTYAQGLDRPTEPPPGPSNLLGVVTIGTPHSGISKGTDLDGHQLPAGVDPFGTIYGWVSAAAAIDLCRQISCYQAGRDVPMFSVYKRPDINMQTMLGVGHAGESVYRINYGRDPFEQDPAAIDAASSRAMRVPLVALLGLTTFKLNITPQFFSGDGLISWQGQRVHPSRSCGATSCSDQTVDNLEPVVSPGFDLFPAGVTEITLGALARAGREILPGLAVGNSFTAYAHSPSVRGDWVYKTKDTQTGVIRSKHLGSGTHDALVAVTQILRHWLEPEPVYWMSPFTDLVCTAYGVCGVEFSMPFGIDPTQHFVTVDWGDSRSAETSLRQCLDEGQCVDMGGGRIRWLLSYPTGTHRIELLHRFSGDAVGVRYPFSFTVAGSGGTFGLSAVPGDQQITLDWTDLDPVRHNLCRAQSVISEAEFDYCGLLEDGTLVMDIDGPPHTQTGLTNNLLYHLRVEAYFGNQRILSTEATARPVQGQKGGTGLLNDTGITWSGHSSSGNAPFCDPAHPAGQDCHYGRDAQAAAGTLTKVGSGSAGFDFTKIANSGADLPASATLGSGPMDWACTRDNVTGLIWEVKVDDAAHLRDQDHTYTWYDPNSRDGNPGTQNGGSCVGSACDTTGFVQAVNAQGLCGASDWRMPTRRELQSIVDYGRFNPAIDTGYFPNTPSWYFWSGSPDTMDSNSAWGVFLNYGVANNNNRSFLNLVRLVRGGH